MSSEVHVSLQPIRTIRTYGQMGHLSLAPTHDETLAVQLIRSHCSAGGSALGRTAVRAMMRERIDVLRGSPSVRVGVAEALSRLLTADLIPFVPRPGAHAHIARVLIGEGHVLGADGQRVPAARALEGRGISPLALRYAEAAVLIRGSGSEGVRRPTQLHW